MAVGPDPEHGAVAGWQRVHRDLTGPDRQPLSADELDELADALFWTDRLVDSIAARRDAYQAHLAAGALDRAAMAAWRLFYEHFLVGEMAVGSGWLERCRRHVDAGCGSTRPAGWLAVAESDSAAAAGDPAAALAHALRAQGVGRECGDRDLLAMALQAEGRAEIGLGHRQRGLGRLDEAMVAVVNDELQPLFTGWVFCNVIATCYELADLQRATEWSEAAMRWCATLREGLLYPGLCRVYWVELACLRGAWSEAEVEARRACAELAAHDQRYAGTAFYLVGELRRLQGDVAGAEEAFDRAHKLGSSPQPGLSRVRLQQGRAADALAALRSALAPGPTAPLPRAQLLSALVEVAAGVGEMAEAERAADELGALAEASGSRLLDGLRSAALGQLSAARGDHRSALADRRRALRTFQELGLPYEAARQQVELAVAAEAVGDNETARLELEAAVTTFERLEAPVDVERARCLLDPGAVGAAGDASPAPSAPRRLASGSRPGRRIVADRGAEPASAPAAMPAVLPEAGSEAGERSPLSGRELDVLRLVADGKTNRDIAETLILSPHTVARHVSNIFTKLGVGSRAAATASAYELGLLGTAPEPD